jgi:hypothetical protein
VPDTLAGGVIAILALIFGMLIGAGLVVNMAGLLANREIGFGEFLVWLLAFIGMLATTIASLNSPLFPLLVLLTMILGLIVPITSWAVDRWGSRAMRTEDLERLLRAVAERPDIPYNFRKLGDLFYERGEFQLAIDYYEQAEKLHHDVHQAFYIEKSRERLTLGKGPPRLCIHCGRMNAQMAFNCIACGEPLPGLHQVLAPLARGRWREALVTEAGVLIGGGILLVFLHVEALGVLALLVGLGLALLHFVLLRTGETLNLPPVPPAAARPEEPPEAKAGPAVNPGETDLPGEPLEPTPGKQAPRRKIEGLDDMEDHEHGDDR